MRRGRASKLVLCVVVVGWLMYGRYRTRQGPPNSMNDDPSPAKLGLTDAELAVHPTVFASDALKDRVIVVSGGAGGIGRAIAWLFARIGAHVAVVGRNQARLDALVAEMASRDLKASAHVTDIREPDAVSALFDAVWAAHGRIDHLINSAGGQFPQPAIDFSVKGWNAVINTNLNGTWYMMQAAAQRWRDHKHPGSIVNIVVVTTHGLYGIAHTIDDAAGVLVVAPGLRRGLHHVPGAVQVGVDDGVPALHRKIDRGLRKLSASAVDEVVDAPVRGPDGVEQRADRVGLADVGDMGGCLEVAAGHFGDQRIEPGLIATDNGDMRADACEQPGDRAPDAAGAAGHDDHPVLQRIAGENRRMDRELRVGQAELCRRWIIVHGVGRPLSGAVATVH